MPTRRPPKPASISAASGAVRSIQPTTPITKGACPAVASSAVVSSSEARACTTTVPPTPFACRDGSRSSGAKRRRSGATSSVIHGYSATSGSQKCWCASTISGRRSNEADQYRPAAVLQGAGDERAARGCISAGAADHRRLVLLHGLRAVEAERHYLALRQGERRVALRLLRVQHRADTLVGADPRPVAVEDRIRVEEDVAHLPSRHLVDGRRLAGPLVESEERNLGRGGARGSQQAADECRGPERRSECRHTSLVHVHSSAG